MASGLYSGATHGVRWWLLRRLPTCREMAAVMSESLERRLSLRERALLKLHLWVCVWCAWYLEHLHLLRDTLRLRSKQEGESSSAPALSAEAHERIKLALHRQR